VLAGSLRLMRPSWVVRRLFPGEVCICSVVGARRRREQHAGKQESRLKAAAESCRSSRGTHKVFPCVRNHQLDLAETQQGLYGQGRSRDSFSDLTRTGHQG